MEFEAGSHQIGGARSKHDQSGKRDHAIVALCVMGRIAQAPNLICPSLSGGLVL